MRALSSQIPQPCHHANYRLAPPSLSPSRAIQCRASGHVGDRGVRTTAWASAASDETSTASICAPSSANPPGSDVAHRECVQGGQQAASFQPRGIVGRRQALALAPSMAATACAGGEGNSAGFRVDKMRRCMETVLLLGILGFPEPLSHTFERTFISWAVHISQSRCFWRGLLMSSFILVTPAGATAAASGVSLMSSGPAAASAAAVQVVPKAAVAEGLSVSRVSGASSLPIPPTPTVNLKSQPPLLTSNPNPRPEPPVPTPALNLQSHPPP